MEMIHGGRGFCKSERSKREEKRRKKEATGFARLLLCKKFERIFAVVGVLFVGYNLTDEGFVDSYNGLISNLKINV